MYVIIGANDGVCQLLKSPCQFERESDKISHKNTSLVISYFLVTVGLFTRGQAMSKYAYSTSVCVCMNVNICVCTCMCVCMCTCVVCQEKICLREE